jgi:GDP-D-mannose 3', 5'-epimerase
MREARGMKTALICGAGGFIGGHLVETLKTDGFWVRGVDLKLSRREVQADDFVIADLRDPINCRGIIDRPFDEVYQLAADMGGAGYIFTGMNDAEIMRNSAAINLNLLDAGKSRNIKRLFYASSACVYPEQNQRDPEAPLTREETAYPANPDSEYGWEKLFSERLYLAYQRNFGMQVRIARYHNIFGPFGAWDDGREKAPAAICRKVAEAARDGAIEIWGDGEQTRSFLHVDECVKATLALMRSDFSGPVNIGSEEMVSINRLAEMVMEVAAKPLGIRHVPGPQGVRGRNSNNDQFEAKLGWRPGMRLMDGLRKTYPWIADQVRNKGRRNCE